MLPEESIPLRFCDKGYACMMYEWYHLLTGYAYFRVQHKSLPSVLNRLLKQKIRFFKVRQSENGEFSFCVSLKNRAKTALVLGESQVGEKSFSLLEKGLVPLLLHYRNRWGLFLGGLIGIFFIILSTFYVWGVTIDTNTAIFSEKELYHFLASVGVRPGAKIADVTDKNLALRFQLDHPEFIFVSFNVEGTKLTAELMERIPPPDQEKSLGTTNLVATRGGIIRFVEVQNGEPMVREGDVVDEGDLLVSGAITLRAGGFRLVESRGKILAETYREFSCFVPFEQVVQVPTGRECCRHSTNVLNFSFLGKLSKHEPFENYTHLQEENTLTLFGAELPFSYLRESFVELSEETVVYDEARAKQLCMDQCRVWLDSVLGTDGELVGEEYQFETGEDGITLKASFTCVENIAVQSPFTFRPLESENTEEGS